MPIQGSAADIMKRAIDVIGVHAALPLLAAGYGLVRMILNRHDELAASSAERRPREEFSAIVAGQDEGRGGGWWMNGNA